MDLDTTHWMSKVIQKSDHGLVIIDGSHQIKIWNEFMESFSGILGHEIRGKNLFESCPQVNVPWLQEYVDLAFSDEQCTFINWRQHPHLFPLSNYKPLTASTDCMYQNVTLMPIKSLSGKIDQLCFLVYDVTESALQEQLHA